MQISSSYSMKGVPYENRCRQNDIPQFSTERAEQENENINPYMADVDNIDILGNTTESAIQAAKQALYHLDHPLEYVPKSIEVQRACMKEREFYVAFLERLEKL